MSRLFIFSGAGLSAESGIPTFRDSDDGLWEKYSIDEVCNYSTWQNNKQKVFEFYNERRTHLADILPNLAHRILAELEAIIGHDKCVNFTQNIDDLLERAGCENVNHVHGTATKLVCIDCGYDWDIGFTAVTEDTVCPSCKSLGSVKPGVIFFGENAPQYGSLIEKFAQAQKGDVILVIGTSGSVVPQEWIIGSYADPTEAFKILVNMEAGMNNLNDFDYWFKEPASECLPKIKQLILEKLGL